MEKLILRFTRWVVSKFLPGWHLHRNPCTKISTLVVNFPKEKTDAQ